MVYSLIKGYTLNYSRDPTNYNLRYIPELRDIGVSGFRSCGVKVKPQALQ